MQRIRSVLAIGLLVLFGFNSIVVRSAHAQGNTEQSITPSVGKPKIVIPESKFDFGSVVDGSDVNHDFLVKNVGTSNLTLQRIVAGCGCTAVAASSNVIPPGQSTTVKVTVDTKGLSGEQIKAIRIYSDDPDSTMSTLEIRGTVDPEVKVDPPNLFFNSITKGVDSAALTKEVRVKVGSHSDIKIGVAKSYAKFIKVTEVSGNDHEKLLRVSLDPTLPLGDLRERVIVSVTGARRSSINIPIFASVKGTIHLDPPALSFGVLVGNDVLVRKVKLENIGKEPFEVDSIKSDNPLVIAQSIPIEKGKSYWIEVRIDPSKVTSDVRAELNIIGNGGGNQEKPSISVFGVLPPKI